MFKILLVTVILLALCMSGLAVRLLVRRNGQFSHRCAMKDLGEGSCAHATSTGRHEDCPAYELHHGNTATQMAKAARMAEAED